MVYIYSNNVYNRSHPIQLQETEIAERNFEKQQKMLRKMSTKPDNSNYNEEALKISQKSSSSLTSVSQTVINFVVII